MARVLVRSGVDIRLSFLVRASEHQGGRLAKGLQDYLRSYDHNQEWFVPQENDFSTPSCVDGSMCMVHGRNTVLLEVNLPNVKDKHSGDVAKHYSELSIHFINNWKAS